MAQRTAGGNAVWHNFHNDYAHIADPNERRRLALAEIDKASFGWYHVRATIVAGIGFFTDAYDIFAIGLVTVMLGVVYFNSAIPASADTAMKVATSGGTVIGQFGFGILADIVGRKKMYGLELIIMISATLAQALSAAAPGITIVGVICFWRVMMGVGIGGDYPLSAVITSEFATTKWRGAMMGAVFAMQGFGQFAAGLVTFLCVIGYRSQLKQANTGTFYNSCTGDCLKAVDQMWRIIIGFGAIPACIALYYRLTIPETPRYTFDVARDIEKGTEDTQAYFEGRSEGHPDEYKRIEALKIAEEDLTLTRASFSDFFHHFGQWKHGKVLLGTAGSWFLLDVAFYGLSLNNSVILDAIGYSTKDAVDLYDILYRTALGNIIIVCAGAIPGYWVTVATVDILGRKPIQYMGFFVLTILFCIIGFALHSLSPNASLGLYVLSQFFFNFGPNATTFIVPGECFPTRYRSSGHGISAASGKMGSIIAQIAIGTLRTRGATATDPSPWLDHVMEIYALFMLLGIGTTYLIPETKRKTLEELSGEEPAAAVALAQINQTSSSQESVEKRLEEYGIAR